MRKIEKEMKSAIANRSCGWQTVTTKSRLNAILDTFFHNVRIVQRQFEWYIDGDSFFDGYTIIR